jgi:hypothetical protein
MPDFFSFALFFLLAFYQVSLLLKDSFVDSFPIKDRPFIKVDFFYYHFKTSLLIYSPFFYSPFASDSVHSMFSVIHRHATVFCIIRFPARLVRI